MRPPFRLPGLLAVACLTASLGAIAALAQHCSPSNPCTTGCCSKFGFCGLGPDCEALPLVSALTPTPTPTPTMNLP
jgi:hypothetical protein